jgi:hypothetical protein
MPESTKFCKACGQLVMPLARDAILAGLYELIRHQDEALIERDERIKELERQLKKAGTRKTPGR